jgi:hypothetical protein
MKFPFYIFYYYEYSRHIHTDSYNRVLPSPSLANLQALATSLHSPLSVLRSLDFCHVNMPDPIPDPLVIFTKLVLVLCVIDFCDKLIEICLVDFQHVGIERAMSSSRPRVFLRI